MRGIQKTCGLVGTRVSLHRRKPLSPRIPRAVVLPAVTLEVRIQAAVTLVVVLAAQAEAAARFTGSELLQPAGLNNNNLFQEKTRVRRRRPVEHHQKAMIKGIAAAAPHPGTHTYRYIKSQRFDKGDFIRRP